MKVLLWIMLLLLPHTANAQSALEWAASQGTNTAVHRTVGAPMEIRTKTQLIAVAERYIGSRRFTPHARAWCADGLNAWLRMAGYRGTGDGRAISFKWYGRPVAGPQIGSIAVMRHHVGIVVGHRRGAVVLLSANHSRRVGIGAYAARRIIAYREPV